MTDDRLNDPDHMIDSTIIKMAEEYVSCDRRSADINESRKNIRDNIEKLGIDPLAFQHAVKQVKGMSEGERRDYQISMNRVLKVISERQNDLFPEAAERIRKREERAAAPKTATPAGKAEANAQSDANPNSEPRIVLTPDANAEEQAEGEAVLQAMVPETTAAKKKSQSQIAREKADAASGKGPSIN